MRVAVLTSFPIYPFREELGVPDFEARLEAWFQVTLAKGLAGLKDIHLHIITTGPSIPRDKSIEYENMKLHYLHIPRYSGILTFQQLPKVKIHRKLAKIRPDIVHGHYTTSPYPDAAISSGYPNVITCHNLVFKLVQENNFLRGFSRDVVRWCLRYLQEKYTLRKAKHIIVASPFMKEALVPYTSAQIYVMTISSITDQFFNARSKEKEGENILLYIGLMRTEKGLLTLLKAMSIIIDSHKNAVLRIVGPKSDCYPQLVEHVKENRLSNNVIFVGYKNPNEVIQELSSASMLILPSTHEPLGLVLGEAMAVGKPVVATRVGGIPHIVKDGETGFLVEPRDAKALADKMMMLLDDRELRMKMGKRGREEAMRCFHPQIVAKKTRDIYEQILSEWHPTLQAKK